MNEITVVVVTLALFAAYFLPTLIAAGRHAQHEMGILALNLLLGWTFLGWVGALVWAVSDSVSKEAQA